MNSTVKKFSLLYGVCVCMLVTASTAAPDVGFNDADDYNGAYLATNISGSEIEFILMPEVDGVELTKGLFEIDAVKHAINTAQISVYLKEELSEIFVRSFTSSFKMKDFVLALKSILDSIPK